MIHRAGVFPLTMYILSFKMISYNEKELFGLTPRISGSTTCYNCQIAVSCLLVMCAAQNSSSGGSLWYCISGTCIGSCPLFAVWFLRRCWLLAVVVPRQHQLPRPYPSRHLLLHRHLHPARRCIWAMDSRLATLRIGK
jgi:hypothetical protein